MADTLHLISLPFLSFCDSSTCVPFPLISWYIHSNRNFTSAAAEQGGSALLAHSSTAVLELHPRASWKAKPKKTCFSPKELLFLTFHFNTTLLFSIHALGLNVQLQLWLAPYWDWILGKGKGKIWFLEGFSLTQAAAISLFQWLYSDRSHIAHTRQASLRSH